MKLQHLRFFVAAIDCGGVVRAAERLRISQPAVSAGLKVLEHELGQRLFESTGAGRRVRPTPKALEFYGDAVEILRRCEAARARIQRKEIQPTKLRIGVLRTIASQHIAAFTHALARSNPELRLQLREGGPVQLQEWLRQGRIDAAWTNIAKPGAHARQLWQEPFVVLAGPMHRFARNRRGKLAMLDLDGENFVLRGSCEMPRGSLWPESLRMSIVARAERDDLALRLVAEGLGIAVAPKSLATADVVARSVRDLDATRSIGLRWRSDLASEMLAAALDALKSIDRSWQAVSGRPAGL